MTPRLATVYGWLLLMPAAILLIAFTHWPTAATLVTSLFSPETPVRPGRFIGADNYRALMDDPVFLQAAWNNLVFAVGTVVPSIALAIVMALWVNARIPARGLLRLAFFTPTILPMVAAANIWLFFYTPEIGLLDQMLDLVGIDGPNWLGDPDWVMGSLIVMTIWKEAGFFMIFYLAALQAIPPELKEAGILEGAGRWAFFWRVTFPLLMPTTLFVLINALLNAFKLVDHLFILTKGGPNNASNLLLYYIYETAFSFFDTAYAAAITMVLLVFLAALAFVKFWLFEKRVHYR